MKAFRKIFGAVVGLILCVFAAANIIIYNLDTTGSGRPYRVEIERLALTIEEKGLENVDLSDCEYVVQAERIDGQFRDTGNDHSVREIDGELYRFDYVYENRSGKKRLTVTVNVLLCIMSAAVIAVLVYVRNKILFPFEQLTDVPYELAKGNLTVPVQESRSRFFGKFAWGMDLLRENMEEQKQRERIFRKENKTLLLSLSHDIKTPLSAIKLYADALRKNLYSDHGKQAEIAGKIKRKADEIEEYVSRIIAASREDFISPEVENSEFYLSDLMGNILNYYVEKLAQRKTEFHTAEYGNCLLAGDLDRSVEVLQNILENAIKYGDGHEITIHFAEEENCQLITVKSSGCTLTEDELPHIFDSFRRGANARNIQGSGLGLYICRQLMHRMNGEIFAQIADGSMLVTVVFGMAG